MKKLTTSFLAVMALIVPISGVFAQSELQVIHNSSDPAAATVDVYVNGAIALDDFAYRTATPFIPLPSGVPIQVGVAPGNSTSANDTIKNFTVVLNPGIKYAAIASGVLAPASFAANPDGVNTAFDLSIAADVRTTSLLPGNVDLLVNHGSTDAPTVDVVARNVAILVNDAAYTDITSYISVPANDYILDVTPGNDNTTIVASYEANLSTLGGNTGIVFASGFLNPAANQNGAAFGLFVAFPNGTVAPLAPISTARLQVIHNAADPGAASVDVYLDGTLALNDFAFRTATPFIDVPAGVTVNIGIAPPTSSSVNDTIVNIPVVFTNGQTYAAIANGVLTPAGFAPNPDGVSTGFTLLLQSGVRENAVVPTEVDFIAVHGSTDAPTVDILARNVATLVDNASYTDITSYISVPPASFILDVTPGNNNSAIVASFTADLTGLTGGSAVVFASGFLDPTTNQNGEAFGLFAALANGTVVPFAPTSQARIQIIHNAADPAAASVDIYLNGSILLDDFDFRTASPFVDAPAGVTINVGVAPSTSTGVNDTIVNIPVQLVNGQTYVAIANGVLNPAAFAVNPDGISTGFALLISDDIREAAQNSGEVDFVVVHGATDAPTVDVLARNVATLVDNAAYTDITSYINVPAASYLLDVTPGNANNTIVASYTADLSGLAGGSAVVFASGFLDPATNQNGEAFGLFAALANGTVVPFPQTSLARLQAIHNAADPAAALVDIYVNGALAVPNFAFRTATPFLDVPGDVTINIGVAGAGSASVNDTIANFPVVLANGGTYVAIANGVLNPANFATNPDGTPTAFTLFLQNEIRESAVNAGEVDFIAVHGASDAPTVDVKVNGGGPILVDNASYSNITPYISVPAAAYTLDVTPGNDNTVIVASYFADLTTLAGGSAVIFASGFLDPAANQNGAAFGLWATIPDGTTFPLSVVTSVNEIAEILSTTVYPNPVNSGSPIMISNNESSEINVEIVNVQGQLVSSTIIPANAQAFEVNTSSLESGVYFVKTFTGEKTNVSKLMVK